MNTIKTINGLLQLLRFREEESGEKAKVKEMGGKGRKDHPTETGDLTFNHIFRRTRQVMFDVLPKFGKKFRIMTQSSVKNTIYEQIILSTKPQ